MTGDWKWCSFKVNNAAISSTINITWLKKFVEPSNRESVYPYADWPNQFVSGTVLEKKKTCSSPKSKKQENKQEKQKPQYPEYLIAMVDW